MPTYWKDILHNFGAPVGLGLFLTILKAISDQKDLLSFDEANGISLDMILVAIGACGFYLKGKEVDVVTTAFVINLLLAGILLYIRYARKRKAVKLAPVPLPETSWWSGIAQLLLGVMAFVWVINAV